MKVASFPTINLENMAEGLIADYGIHNSQYNTGIKDFINLIKKNEAYVLNGGKLQDVAIIDVED